MMLIGRLLIGSEIKLKVKSQNAKMNDKMQKFMMTPQINLRG